VNLCGNLNSDLTQLSVFSCILLGHYGVGSIRALFTSFLKSFFLKFFMVRVSISVSFSVCKLEVEWKVGCWGPISTASSPGYWDSTMTYIIILTAQFNCMVDRDNENAAEEIPAMPEQFRYGVNRIVEALQPVIASGLKAVLLFGVPSKLTKVTILYITIGIICIQIFCLFLYD